MKWLRKWWADALLHVVFACLTLLHFALGVALFVLLW